MRYSFYKDEKDKIPLRKRNDDLPSKKRSQVIALPRIATKERHKPVHSCVRPQGFLCDTKFSLLHKVFLKTLDS